MRGLRGDGGVGNWSRSVRTVTSSWTGLERTRISDTVRPPT